jgi:hypothetical protein
MRGFIKQYADAEFDPATVSILEDVFEVAWTRVRASKAPFSGDEYAPAGRAIIDTYIISAAKAGERDPRWLADSAILYLSPAKTKPKPTERIAKHRLLIRAHRDCRTKSLTGVYAPLPAALVRIMKWAWERYGC